MSTTTTKFRKGDRVRTTGILSGKMITGRVTDVDHGALWPYVILTDAGQYVVRSEADIKPENSDTAINVAIVIGFALVAIYLVLAYISTPK